MITKTKQLANLCCVTTQTIRRKLKASNLSLPLTDEETHDFLKTHYKKIWYTVYGGTLGKGKRTMLQELTTIGKIVKITNTSGTTYWYLRNFPMRYLDNNTIEYYKQPKGFTSREEVEAVRKQLLQSRKESYRNIFVNYIGEIIEELPVSYTTKKCYRSVLRNKFKPFFKTLTFNDLNRRLLQHFIDQVVKSRKHTIVVLKLALETLYQDDLIPKDYFRQLRISRKESHKTKQAMTREQLEAFFREAKGNFYEHLVRLMYATGIRVSEALALQWDDITYLSESLGVLSITKAYGEIDKGKKGLKDTKTTTSRRKVYFNDPYVIELLKMAQERSRFNKWVAEGKQRHQNKPISREYFNSYVIRPIAERAGIPFTVSTHHARVNYTSHALAKGIDEKILQEQLGHANTYLIHSVYGKPIGNRRDVLEQIRVY